MKKSLSDTREKYQKNFNSKLTETKKKIKEIEMKENILELRISLLEKEKIKIINKIDLTKIKADEINFIKKNVNEKEVIKFFI